jgi:hypothetical protein
MGRGCQEVRKRKEVGNRWCGQTFNCAHCAHCATGYFKYLLNSPSSLVCLQTAPLSSLSSRLMLTFVELSHCTDQYCLCCLTLNEQTHMLIVAVDKQVL